MDKLLNEVMLPVERQDGLGIPVVHQIEDVVSARFIFGGRVIDEFLGDVDVPRDRDRRPGSQDRRRKLLRPW